jgi:hypothetical protein
MKGRFSDLLRPSPQLLVWGVLASVLLAGCARGPRFATETEAAMTGLVLRAPHVTVSGGALTVRNAGTRPCFLTNPYHCSVYLTLYDAQHRPLLPNRKEKRYCDPAKAGPILLAPGDSMRYTLESPRKNHDEEQLRKARFFAVVYQGLIAPKAWDTHRPRRVKLYTLKTSGAVD